MILAETRAYEAGAVVGQFINDNLLYILLLGLLLIVVWIVRVVKDRRRW